MAQELDRTGQFGRTGFGIFRLGVPAYKIEPVDPGFAADTRLIRSLPRIVVQQGLRSPTIRINPQPASTAVAVRPT